MQITKKNRRKKKEKKSLNKFLKKKKENIKKTKLLNEAETKDNYEKKNIEEHFKLRHKGMNKWTMRQKKRSFLDSLTLKYLKEQHVKRKVLRELALV